MDASFNISSQQPHMTHSLKKTEAGVVAPVLKAAAVVVGALALAILLQSGIGVASVCLAGVSGAFSYDLFQVSNSLEKIENDKNENSRQEISSCNREYQIQPQRFNQPLPVPYHSCFKDTLILKHPNIQLLLGLANVR